MTPTRRSLTALALMLFVMGGLAGCRAKPASESLAESGPDAGDEAPMTAPEEEPVGDPFGTAADLSEETIAEEPLAEEADAGWIESQLQTIYFDFDQSSLSEIARAALDQNASFLLDNPGLRIRVEGHCDDRGTVEYNLSLGDRRANSVKAYLVQRGVPAENMQVVSFGEERPVDPGQNEAAWAKNRRAEFHVQ